MTIYERSRGAFAMTAPILLLALTISTPVAAKGGGLYEPVPLKKREVGLMRASSEYVEEFSRHGLLYHDRALQSLLDRVGRAVAPDPVDPYVEYRFHILRGPEPNAFALPDGQIFVHTG